MARDLPARPDESIKKGTMHRRKFLGATLASSFLPLRNAHGVAGDRPNVVLMMADDLGWGDPGFNGNRIIHTPNLDEMAKRGIRFTRFYSGGPVCSPTRGTCMTGRHYFRYGVTHANEGMLPKQEITVASMLKPLGYTTGHFGKWHLGTLTRDLKDGRRGGPGTKTYMPPWEHGFDVSFSTEQAVPTWDPMQNQPFATKYWEGPGRHATENLEGDDSRVMMDRVIPFITKAAKAHQPFLAVVWFHAPHQPVVAGPKYRAMYSAYDEGQQHFFG
jgi:arylsulfatase A-like enzyme